MILLTATSKLLFYRIGLGEITEFKEVPNLHDYECLDFEISWNNKYIATVGKEGLIKVYDYFMRGTKIIPSSQAFLGHLKHPWSIIFGGSGDRIYTIGD